MTARAAATAALSVRPRFHLTPERHWMNDPNGLVRVDGVWHAFFQHNPDGIEWGNMSWGHASSPDLLRWTPHPVALRHRVGEQIYSGSIVADADGTLTAFYTSAYAHGIQAQSRATSRDGGLTWTPDADNPVLDRGSSDFRDPKVIPLPGGGWLLVAVEAVERRVLFYVSDDLRHWRETGAFGPVGPEGVVWECPDLVPLDLDGDPARARWVLLLSTNPVGEDADPRGSAMHVVVGDLVDGVFHAEDPDLHPFDHGPDCYAGVTFANAPDSAPMLLAWMGNWRYAHDVPSEPWRGAMSLPRELHLRTIDGRARLVQRPAASVRERLADATAPAPGPIAFAPHALVEVRWEPNRTGTLRLRLEGADGAVAEIVHDPAAAALSVARTGPAARAVHPDFAGVRRAPLTDPSVGHLLLSLDGPLLEVFAEDGATVLSQVVPLGGGPVTLGIHGATASDVALRRTVLEEPTEGAAAPAAA